MQNGKVSYVVVLPLFEDGSSWSKKKKIKRRICLQHQDEERFSITWKDNPASSSHCPCRILQCTQTCPPQWQSHRLTPTQGNRGQIPTSWWDDVEQIEPHHNMIIWFIWWWTCKQPWHPHRTSPCHRWVHAPRRRCLLLSSLAGYQACPKSWPDLVPRIHIILISNNLQRDNRLLQRLCHQNSHVPPFRN